MSEVKIDRAERERLRGLRWLLDATEIGEYHVECRSCNEVFSTEKYGPADEDLIAVCSGCAYKFADPVPRLIDALDAAEAKVAALEARLAEVAPVVEVLLSMQANEFYVGQARLREAMSALRAARAKRENGST